MDPRTTLWRSCGRLPSSCLLGFNALVALATWLWNTPASISAVFTIAEAAAVALLYSPLRVLFGECVAKRSIILYLTSPVCILCAFATQDETLILLGLAAILRFSASSNVIAKYVCAFLAFAFTKILTPIYVVAFFIWHKRKGLVIFALCLAAYWGISYAIGVDPFDIRFGREIGMNPTRCDHPVENPLAGNIWFYLPKTPLAVKCLVLFAPVAVSGLCFIRTFFCGDVDLKGKCEAAVAYTCIIFFTFQLLYPMVYHGYMIPVVALCYAMFLCAFRRKVATGVLLCGFVVWQIVFVTKDGSSRLLDMIDPSRIVILPAFMLGGIVLCAVCFFVARTYCSNPLTGIKSLLGIKK